MIAPRDTMIDAPAAITLRRVDGVATGVRLPMSRRFPALAGSGGHDPESPAPDAACAPEPRRLVRPTLPRPR